MSRQFARSLTGAAALVWLAAWLWIGHNAMLDDALIHLRYAHHFLREGFFTFNGETPSYGTSSPLYVLLLSTFLPFSSDPLLAKAVSVAGYLLLLVLAALPLLEENGFRTGWAALLVLLIGPMSQRWLADGMETGLTGAFVLALAAVVLGKPDRWKRSIFLLFIFGVAIVLLRVELSLVIFFAVLGAACILPSGQALRRLAPLALGGLTGLALLLLIFGHVLPDTAVAKQTASIPLGEALFQMGRSTLAALSLGGGAVLLWILLLALGLWRGSRAERWALLIANLLFPCVAVLIAARGQILHGVRHLLWIYLFLIAWNLRILSRMPDGGPALARWGTAVPGKGLAAGLMALGVLWSFEMPKVLAIQRDRSEILLDMRGQHLERLSGLTGAAYDIGFIAFFSRARMLDGNGLINGRDFAALPGRERMQRIGASRPDFLFLTAPQAAGLAPSLDLAAYRVCHRYRSRNLDGEQVHLLALRASLMERFGGTCQETLPATLSSEAAL